MWFKRITSILALIFVWQLLPDFSFADRIVLRDGTVEESERVWTSEKFVHFILKGTQSVEIRYAIDIVERVERDDNESQVLITNNEMKMGEKRKKDELQSQSPQNHASYVGGTNLTEMKDRSEVFQKIERESKGIRFYDPRSSKRYRVSKTSAHNDLHSALNELAEIYGRTPDWVEVHMGEENDIQIIHRNLADRRKIEMMSKRAPLPGGVASTADNRGEMPGGHKTPGLRRKPSTNASQAKSAFPELNIDKRTKFYDPRRKKKYWSGNMTHHSSLHEALASLSRQYNVTPKWIEDHMGDSNLLADIHESIRSSLLRE
jgi:hypothetical protein